MKNEKYREEVQGRGRNNQEYIFSQQHSLEWMRKMSNSL